MWYKGTHILWVAKSYDKNSTNFLPLLTKLYNNSGEIIQLSDFCLSKVLILGIFDLQND